MLSSSLYDYRDGYILVSETITVEVLAAGRKKNTIQVVFKDCPLFTNCTSDY